MIIDIDAYTFPYSKCPCKCGAAIDAMGMLVLPANFRAGEDPPTFEEVMAAVYGCAEAVPVGEVTGCKCGSWATYGKGGSGHSDWCPEYQK